MTVQHECKTCLWWQDYTRRVYARVTVRRGDIGSQGLLELRQCRYVASPTVSDVQLVYTDEEYTCSNWTTRRDD